MIIDISVENFLSIREKVTLSFEAGSSSKLENNIIKTGKNGNLIKSIAIYGANASGKSNIIKSMLFFWRMVVNSAEKKSPDEGTGRIPFKLDERFEKQPSRFDMNFIIDGVKYSYGFSCDDEKIIEEYLYHSPNGRRAMIFKREKTDVFEFNSEKELQEMMSKQTLRNTLYVSRATQLNNELTRKVYDFFKKNIIINYDFNHILNSALLKFAENPQKKDEMVKILKAADFGGIEDFNVKIKKIKVKHFSVDINKEKTEFKDDEQDFPDAKFMRMKKMQDGRNSGTEFNLMEESEGTRLFIAIFPRIIELIESEKVFFVDEFERSLHPDILKFMIRFFNEKCKKSQIVFTTHNTTLLNNGLFRKDQIYFTAKEPGEGTKLIRLLDFGIRQEDDFQRAYLNGRFGGLPFIDETLFD